ncbi:dipeptide ABC transporter ATP-binding protein [Jiella pacifica]|uniref:Dipeptide ABC transporter ATP-binding protein n=1 Tax=Jiella pacifica TaxID=2696469 RepID=A0A6N9T2R3_9HYPH|nr:ABC transporter ATP-binding protein [Jiella pacifica]NDW05653.1 dipeptide ABC transporter ATP-binding protein [Jiella pacifica]
MADDPSKNDPILSIRDLTVALPEGGDRPYAVEGLSLEVRPREIVCIVGESGSGKSITAFTTMGLLPGALRPTGGELRFEGRDLLAIRRKEHAALRGKKIAMVFQEPMSALNPCYMVGDQIVEVFATHTALSKAERKAKTLALMDEVKLPDPERIYRSYPHQLSGGQRQRQRIVIAIALALDPRLLIADEPTTALDVTTQAQILHLFGQLRENHDAGILFVTHNFDVVAEIADRVVVMEKGKIVEEGPVGDVLNRPQHPYTRLLISAVPKRHPSPRDEVSGKAIALKVEGLEKSFRLPGTMFREGTSIKAVAPASFAVRENETLGIVGESGSGKSTLVRCLIRLIEPNHGSVEIGGVDVARLDKRAFRIHRKDIQIIFQDPYGSLNPRRTVGDQLIEGPVNFGVPRETAIQRARELMRIVRMDEDAVQRYPVQFSGGQRQRICIARALAVEPKILIADEAVSALDVSVQKEVLNLLNDIKKRLGLTLLFITHDLRVAGEVCDNVLVMEKGEIVERGSVAEVFGNPRHTYTRALLDAMPGKGWDVPDLSAIATRPTA